MIRIINKKKIYLIILMEKLLNILLPDLIINKIISYIPNYKNSRVFII